MRCAFGYWGGLRNAGVCKGTEAKRICACRETGRAAGFGFAT